MAWRGHGELPGLRLAYRRGTVRAPPPQPRPDAPARALGDGPGLDHRAIHRINRDSLHTAALSAFSILSADRGASVANFIRPGHLHPSFS